MAIHYAHPKQVDTVEDATDLFLSTVKLENEQTGQEGEALTLLTSLLRRYGKEFVVTVDKHLEQEGKESDIATTLTLLGQAEHPKTAAIRLQVLLKNLSAPQVRMRDGAVAGLSYLMSKDALLALDTAAKIEHNRHLRRDMENLIKLLTEALFVAQ